MVSDLMELRRRVDALGPPSTTRRYPVELREELCAAACALVDVGATVVELEAAFGISYTTFWRWSLASDFEFTKRARKARKAFCRVEVSQESQDVLGARFVIHGPCGYRVEMNDVSSLVDLLRSLS